MAHRIAKKLDEIERTVRKMEAVSAFIYEMEPEDFVNDEGILGEIYEHGSLIYENCL